MAALVAAPAMAEPRIALVIGNGAYEHVGGLENPSSDAELIAKRLGEIGFEVTLLRDAGLGDMRRGVAEFGKALRAAGPDATGLFYYAGHGVQSFGSNYLLPIDAQVTNAADLDLVGIEAQSVLRQMYSAKNKTNIVILDACRNNPFQKIPDMGDNGLAEMKAPTGTFLAYATEPQAVALDGADGHSPFTQALAQVITDPGVPIEQMFKRVRVAVLDATGGRQTPWDTSSLTQDFTFVPGKVLTAEELAEEQLWASVVATRDPVQVMLFMRAYPNGRRFEEARKMLAELMQDVANGGNQVAAAEPDPSRAATPEPPPAPKVPDAQEQKDFDAAMTLGTVAGWEEFMARHAGGAFAEIAESELAAAREKSGHDPAAQLPPPDGPTPLTAPIRFASPLTEGGDNVRGKSLEELVKSQPLFVPVEGLPDEAWKGRHCFDCHQWTQQDLCKQGQFYVDNQVPDQWGDIHPLGGQLRQVIKAWAQQGCE